MNKHTMVAVIDGEKIEAEYLEFDEFNCFNLLSDSSDLWDKITTLFYWIKNTVRDIYWEVRYGFQRMFKGYDYEDTFETCAKFVDRYYKILTDYKKNHYGYPLGLTEEEWNGIIDDMLRHLYYMNEDNVEKELSKYILADWTVSDKTLYEVAEKHKNEFFKLFSEYFYNLWD